MVAELETPTTPFSLPAADGRTGGITLVGKRTRLPDHLTVGRNCRIAPDLRAEDFTTATVASGETVEPRTYQHSWERDLAGRLARRPPG